NADGSGDTITFNIPNSDSGCFGTPKVCHIDVTTTQFPPLTANTTTIDAYTQPGSSKNTLGIVAHATSIPGPVTPQSLGTNADLRIQLVGNNGLYDASLCPGINFGFDVQGHFN